MKVAVVTGANKGIGLEVCRQLAKDGFKVVLTARNTTKGNKAVQKLRVEGFDVVFHKLDVTSKKDANDLASFLKKEFGQVNVLVNNAGIYLDGGRKAHEVDLATAKKTLNINLFGVFAVSQALLPLMKRGSRIVNVSSHAGQLNGILNMSMASRAPFYGISKLALNGLTIKLAGNGKGIKVNAVAPGWVRTDMGGKFAPRSTKKGAETIVWLATEEKIPNGKFLSDKKVINW